MKPSFKINMMAFAVATAVAVAGSAALAKGPGSGGGGGGGGEPPPSEASQSLSVPAILVGGLGTLVCGTEASPSTLVPPTGAPSTGYELDTDAYWWVQKVNTWQAQCFNAGIDTVSVFGAWGDNLTGDASLKTGSPIRVELVLTNSGGSTLASMAGYKVLKLEPSKLDRESAYGHDAVSAAGGDTPDTFVPAEWVVHDSGMMLEVKHLASGTYPVPLQAIAPEINATGKVVYGYNLRVSAAGTYQIHFIAPNVTFTGCDAGTCEANGNDAYLDIVVGGGGGGGGGKKGGRP